MKRVLLVMLALLAVAGMVGAQSKGQEIIMNNGAEPQTLDPHHIEGVPEHRIYMALFEGLTTHDPKTSRAVPGVASKWTFSKDLKTVTFTLRKAVWSDGTPITAKDFVESWIRKLDPKEAAQYADLLYVVEGAEAYNTGKAGPEALKIRAVDDSTFEVKLVGPTPHFPDMVAHYAFAAVPMHAVKKHGLDWVKPGNFVGNGPFLLQEWKPQERLVFVPNPKYWDAKTVKLQKITLLPIDDLSTSYQMYKAGKVDWLDAVPLELMDEIKLRKDYQNAPYYGTYYYIYNVTRKPLDDPRVRKALSMAFDRQALVDKVTKGGQIPAFTFVPASAGFKPPAGLGYNIEQAKKLLAEAGYPDGKGFPTFQILYNTSSSHQRIAAFIQEEWKRNLGINVTLINQEWSTYLDTRSQSHDFDIARAGWIGDYLDPSTFSDMWIIGGTQNDGLYNSKEYTDLIFKARTQAGATRMKTLMQAEDVLIMKDHAIMPIYFYVTNNLIDLSKWGGWYLNPLGSHPWKYIYRK